ncbi:hypothetical protein RvY_02105 [Ramazzottius varieornatus]|uniref:Uncharacterized protein n=1 Tax=Ramazzottius varieornatus TaxID=947166 RepID=A0A1D1UTR0_RAMVA|nr:hypothetical protein RvY_02105 [Ramazzottius varieornatus]
MSQLEMPWTACFCRCSGWKRSVRREMVRDADDRGTLGVAWADGMSLSSTDSASEWSWPLYSGLRRASSVRFEEGLGDDRVGAATCFLATWGASTRPRVCFRGVCLVRGIVGLLKRQELWVPPCQ